MPAFFDQNGLPSTDENRRLCFVASPEEAGLRLDMLLVGRQAGLTRTRAARLIDEGNVLVDGRPCRAGQKMKAGAEVALELPDVKPYLAALPEDIPLNVVYEDVSLIVIDKPAGMVVHPAAGHYEGTLVNALLFHCRDLSGIGGELRPGIVHRLDKDTSGLLVAAKSDGAHAALAAQFKRHQVKKTYLAVVCGQPRTEGGRIETSIGRHPSDRKKMSTRSDRGRSAITVWRVRERYRETALLEVDIETGRTHQIRVHLADIGHPVVGDSVYGRAGGISAIKDAATRRLVKTFPRQALHAWRLAFTHPTDESGMTFVSPLPKDMAELCAALKGKTESM